MAFRTVRESKINERTQWLDFGEFIVLDTEKIVAVATVHDQRFKDLYRVMMQGGWSFLMQGRLDAVLRRLGIEDKIEET